jgi:outer membrane murein-binding lipoprotein Lpp
MTRPKNGTLTAIVGIAVIVAGMAVAWGSTREKVNEHERCIRALENKQDHIHLLVVKMAALQGINTKE